MRSDTTESSKSRYLISMIFFLLLALAFQLLSSTDSFASINNRLYRVEIKPKSSFTRLSFNLSSYSKASVSELSNNRLRLVINNTETPLFKKYRRYSDSNIGGLIFLQRGDQSVVTFQIGKNRGWRVLNNEGVSNVTVDIGEKSVFASEIPPLAGRERIRSGIGKLVRDFDPPFKTDIPFTPTDRQLLAKLLPPEEQKIFGNAEAALYKQRFSEAEELFKVFAARNSEIKPLALYRLGETWYNMQKYKEALQLFREGERFWAAYLGLNPSITFYYGDSIVRSGDLPHGRELLSSLIGRLADKKYSPTLLVRLGDIYSRHGHDNEATALYQNVADNFEGNKARQMARLRLNDRLFTSVNRLNYKGLSESYKKISESIGDFDMREEALFKHTLLEALHGESFNALQDIMHFQKKYPRGAFETVARTIRESLVKLVYIEGGLENTPESLIRFTEEHQEYLAELAESPNFLRAVSKSYEDGGRLIEKVRLFSFMLERQWAKDSAPALYEEVAEDAETIGDSKYAVKTLRTLLNRFPDYSNKTMVSEKLGALLFNQGKYLDAKNSLTHLQNRKERVQKTNTIYILGKSIWELKEYKNSIEHLERFIRYASPSNIYLSDAYYSLIFAKEVTGDNKSALTVAEKALSIPKLAENEPILYKAGILNIRYGDKKNGKEQLDKLLKSAKDSDWKRLAQQALADAKL